MNPFPILTLAKIVRFHRKKAKLTQENLAKLAGVGKTAVFDLEKENRRSSFPLCWPFCMS